MLKSIPFALDLPLILVLGAIFYEDLRYREVHWVLFPVLVALCFARFFFFSGEWLYPLFNYIFLIGQLLIMVLYVVLRYRTTALLNKYFGLGDLLLWGAVAWAFSPLNFIAFHFMSLLLSLFVGYVFLRRSLHKGIPLAGVQSLLLMLLVIFKYGLYNDIPLFTLLSRARPF